MGWGNCGSDTKGRPIGYYQLARCDHPGCDAEIDRGLAHACGGMHGENGTCGGDEGVDWASVYLSCEGYFCEKHLRGPRLEHEDGAELCAPFVCDKCATDFERRYRTDDEMRDLWPTKAPPLPLTTEPSDDRPAAEGGK